MSAYKFLEDGQIVWAGKDFFYYNERRRQPVGLVGTEAIAEKAQLIQGQDQTFYYTDWLHDLPEAAAGLYEESDAEEISDEEYEAIKAILDAGGTVEDTDTGGTEDTTEQETVVDTSLEGLKKSKIAALSAECESIIEAGVDVTLSDGESHHFSLSEHDQNNLNSLSNERQLAILTAMLTGATTEEIAEVVNATYEYHADGELCCYYSAEDFTKITAMMTAWKKYHEAYFNSLKLYINSLEDVVAIAAIEYGVEIPEEYQSEVYQNWAAQITALSAASTEEAEE